MVNRKEIKKPAVILGLDGFHEGLLNLCPNIKEIYNNSISGTLKSTIPPLTMPAWATIHTGKDVGTHGVYGFLKFDDRNFTTRVFRQSDIKHPFFYEYLYNVRYKLFLMNIPFTEPPRIPGDVIQSWFTRSDRLEDYLVPEDLIDRYPSIKKYKVFPNYIKNFSEVLDIFKSQKSVIREIIEFGDYDIVFTFISVTDWIQHQTLPEILDGKNKKGLRILKDIDELVGWISDHVEILLLFSDHGFKVYNELFFLNNWLKKEKYLIVKSKSKVAIGRETVYKRNINVRNLTELFYKNKLLYKIGSILKPLIENLFKFNFIYDEYIDIEKSIVFTVENTWPSIFVNRNIPKEKRKVIMSEIIRKLNTEGIEAKSSEELYGVSSDDFPDVFIVNEKYYVVKGCGKMIKAKFNRGFHSVNGFFAIKTPEVKPKKINMKLVDLAPTILDLFNVGVPKDMVGKSIFGGVKRIEPLYYQFERQKITKKVKELRRKRML